MSSNFDPYREWLGADATAGALSHYQLLGLADFETDSERIENAEMAQMARVLRHEQGPFGKLVPTLCAELEAAVRCLADPVSKAAYDAKLRAERHASPKSAEDGLFDDDSPVQHEISPPHRASPSAASDDSFTTRSPNDPVHAATPHEQAAADEDVLAGDDPGLNPARASSRANSSLSSTSALKRRHPLADGQPGHLAGQSSVSKIKRRQPEAPRAKTASGGGFSWPEIPLAGLAAAIGGVAAVLFSIWILPGLLNAGPDAAPYLEKLQHADPLVRLEGVDALRFLDLNAAEKTGLLLRILHDDQSDTVRVAAANALVSAGPLPADKLPEAKRLLSNEKHPGVKPLLVWLVEKYDPAAAR